MGEAFLDYKKGGSGLDINGIIEDYYVYAGEKVNAGDFVEFINGVADKVDCGESAPVYPSAVQKMGERPRAVTLDDNRVLVLYRYGTNAYLYGMVCTIEGASIVLGAETAIEEVKGAGGYISPIVLPNGLVLVLNGYSSANFKLRGVLISINGTTISLVTTTQIYGGSYCYNHSPVLISDNKVFVAFSTGSSEYLYGIVLTVTQTSISAGTALELNNASGSGSQISAEVLDNGDVFIAHSYSALQLYCTICGIEGTVVTKKTYTLLSTATYASSSLSTTKLKNGDIFIAHCYGTDYHLYGMVCKVNGTTVTEGTDTVISTVSDTARNGENKLCSILLDNGDVFIAHNHNGTSGTCYLYGVVCSVNDTTITVHEDVQLSAMRFSGWYNSATKLKNGNIFIAHSYNQSYMYLSTQLFGVDEANKVPTKQIIDTTYETQVRPATSLPCKGVASTSGEGGDSSGHKDIVSVYTVEIPKPTNLVVNGDFSNGVSGWYYDDVNDFGCFELSAENNILAINIVDTSNGNEIIKSETNINTVADHIYYARMEAKSTSNGDFVFNMVLYGGSGNIITNDLVQDGEWHILSLRGVTKEASYPLRFACYKPIAGNTIECKNVAVYDLTARYGAGNEPTKEWCDANL